MTDTKQKTNALEQNAQENISPTKETEKPSAKGKDKKNKKKGVRNDEISKKLQKEVITGKKSTLHGRKKTFFLIAMIFLGAALFFTGGVFGVLSLIQENSMRITVTRSYVDALALYSSGDLNKPTTLMNVRGPSKMDNITYSWLPKDIGEYKGGSHNGDNYIAFTFYLRNESSEDILYQYEIVFKERTKNVDGAIRVMVIEEGESVVYAKAKPDGSPEPISNDPAMLTTPFIAEDKVLSKDGQNIASKQAIKYTVVIWLEGEDSDCNDSILGGWVSVEMRFNVQEQ
jgi:hypothetical protein